MPKAAVTNTPATSPTPGEKAWGILREGIKDKSVDKRALAVRALGLLTGDVEAENSAITALEDKNASVRSASAAAAALGSMHAEHAKLALEGALEDSEPAVVLAAANSLLLLHDSLGYDIYFAVLTGERRADKGMIKGQMDTLKNKKQMAKLGFAEGIGFIPFAGMGYEAFKTVTKNDSSPVRAAAAKQLAHDPATAKALVAATTDKKWQVRAAALEAIAQRDDPSLLGEIAPALNDEKDLVRFTAAACVAHLADTPAKKNKAKP
ncbi:MAG TPA: HEAT repeat domain-containing protein [Candidatus Acidoferrum sp.]